MEISNEILNQYVNPHTNNEYFLHAKETFEYLKNKKEKNFISDDVSYAVKTLERFYKGFLYDAWENTSYVPTYNKEKGKNILEYSHNLKQLRHEIISYFPEVFPTISIPESKRLDNKLLHFAELYTGASYDRFATYQDLTEVIRFTEQDVNYINEFLNKDKPYGDDTIELD